MKFLYSLLVVFLLACVAPESVSAQQVLPTKSYYPALPGRNKAGIAVTRSVLRSGSQEFPIGSYITWGGYGDYFNDTIGVDNSNDVWASADGSQWTCVSGRYRTSATEWTSCAQPNNGLSVTAGSTPCSDSNGNLYLIGGENTVPGQERRQTHNTVYISSNNGLSWVARTNTALPARSYANCITSSSKIFVMNGVLDYNDVEGDWRNPGNDIWWANFGTNPTFSFVGNGQYAPRGAAMATSVVDNSMYHYDRIFYVLGGWSDFTNTSLNNDVYYSTNLGVSWTQATSRASWSARADSNIVSTPRGFLVMVGGRTQVGGSEWVVVNDVYLSADGGVSWYLRQGNFTGRIFPALTTSADKARLVVAFGANGPSGPPRSDVQISNLQLDDETAETMRQWGMRPNQATSSCIGLFACTNELGFVARTGSAPWSARYRHSVHYSEDRNRLVLFGGLPAGTSGSTWSSPDNGASWSQLSSQGMPMMNGACFHADADDNLYITGGSQTFISRNLGASWENRTTSSLFPTRQWHNCLSDSKGNMYVLNGYGANSPLNDVYMSADQGATWSLLQISIYAPRAGASTAVWRAKPFDVIYMVGGVSGYLDLPKDDVFYSTDGMKTWQLGTLDSPWAARQDASLSVASNGVLVLTGGLQTLANNVRYYFNDVWVSFNGGTGWAVIEDATYSQRAFGAGVFLSDQSFAMIGGYGSVYSASGALSFVDYNDVWASSVKFDDDHVATLKAMSEWVETEVPTCNAPPALCAALASSGSGISAGAVIGVLIAVPCGLFLIWALYSLRVHGEVRIPFTERSCNCCNSALRRDTLFDDEYSLHKGTGKYKSSVNSSASHRLMDD